MNADSKRQKRNFKTILTGFFFVVTGIGFILDIYYNNLFDFFESKNYSVLGRTIIWAFLIAWITFGVLVVIWGFLKSQKESVDA